MRCMQPTVLALLAGLASGQTFVVDAAGGPGVQFVEISAAVAAVPDGATVIVRPGTYQGFTITGKGLTVLGDPATFIDGLVVVENTSASQVTKLRGFDWVLYTGPPTGLVTALITLTNCAGRVVLEELDTSAGVNCLLLFSQCSWTPGLSAMGVAQLIVRDSAIHAGALLANSSVLIESCDFIGKSFWDNSAGGSTGGIALFGCDTQIAGASQFTGGWGTGGMAISPAGPGISVSGGSLRLLAGTATGGGMLGAATLPPKPALSVGNNAVVRVDPDVVLTAFGVPALSVDPSSVVTMPRMPAVTSTGAAPGGTSSASVSTEPGDLVILLLGLPGPPAPVPGFTDPFWLDPAVFVFHSIGTQQSGAPVTGTLPVPGTPALRGAMVVWQAVASGPVTGLSTSNPSFSLIR